MIQFLRSNIYISHLQVNEKFSSKVPSEKENTISVEIGILIGNTNDFTLAHWKTIGIFPKKICVSHETAIVSNFL